MCKNRKIYTIIVFVLFLTAVYTQTKEEEQNIAVMVEGFSITKNQIFDLMKDRYPVQTQEIITELILYQIVKLEAKSEKIAFSPAFLENKASEEIQKFKQDIEKKEKQTWQDYLLQRGVKEEKIFSDTVYRLRYKIALQCLIRLSQMREIQIDARHIMVSSQEKAQEILNKLKLHADFEALAQKESLSATKSQGGRFPRLFPGDIDPSLEKALFALQPMQMSEIIISPWGYHILQVLKVYPPKPDASWGQDRMKILDSIERNPVDDRELKRWIDKMKKKYQIKQNF